MPYETLKLDREPPIATLRLDRPERMNAVIESMYREIRQALDRIEADRSVRCVILTGSDFRRDGVVKPAFCAGADLKEHAAGRRSASQRRAYIELAHETTRAIAEFPRPILAAVRGPARGAGMELALSCDLLLVAESATLALPETSLGTFVGGGVTRILPGLVGRMRARELVYTGRVIDGAAAAAMGLALACHPDDRLLEEARALARAIAEKAPVSIAHAKRLLERSPGGDLAAALHEETEAILQCMETEDWHEGLRAFRDKRPPRFTGS